MPILVPVAHDEMLAETFATPVANALNLLTAKRVIAGVQALITMNSIGNGVWSNVTGIAVSFTAKANWAYMIGWTAICTGASGQWVNAGVSINGGSPARFLRAAVIAPGAPAFGMDVGGSLPACAALANGFSAGVQNLQLQVTAAGGAVNINNGAPCLIYVADMGADV